MKIRLGLIIAALLLFTGIKVYPQTGRYVLSGQVTDGDGELLPGANVELSSVGDSTATLRTATGKDGGFEFSAVPAGDYELTITYMGCDDYRNKMKVNGDKHLGKIRMNTLAKMLDEVTVMARYTDVKLTGETVIRVAGNPLAKGQTFLNFLKNVRNLDVTDKSIKVQGRDNTLFYLDDRRISFDQLKALSPSMISRIEVVPQADASYGINATGGVVKVYLRDTGGLLGSLSFYGQADKYGYVDGSPRLNLLYSKGKFSISNMLRVCPYSHYTIKNKQDNGDGQEPTVNDAVNRDRAFEDNLSLRYAFNKTDRIDVYGGVYLLKEKYRNNSVTGADNLIYRNDKRSQSYSAGLHLRKGFGNGGSFVQLFAEYSKNKDKNNEDYDYNGYADPANENADMDLVSVKPQMYWQINKTMKLTAGLWYQYMADRHNDIGTAALGYIDDGRYTNYGLDYEAWAQYSATFNEKLYVRAGLTYHGTETDFHDFLDKTNNVYKYENGVYPTLFGQWTFNKAKMHYVYVSYRHYYSLPNYNYLLPSISWQGENVYSIGNPGLNKENYDNIEVFYSPCREWSLSYDFTYGSDMVNVMMHQDESQPGVYYTRPENTGQRQRHRIRINYSGRIFKFWYCNTTLYGIYMKESLPQGGYHNMQAIFNSNNDFTLSKNFALTLGFWAATKSKSASYASNAKYNIDLGGRLSLFKGKMDVNLSWSNMLYNHNKITVKGDGWTIKRRDENSSSRIQLSLAWNFSAGGKIKKENLPSVNRNTREIPTF